MEVFLSKAGFTFQGILLYDCIAGKEIFLLIETEVLQMAEEKENVTETKTEETQIKTEEAVSETKPEVKAEENAPVFAENDGDGKEEVVFAPIDTPSRKPVGQAETKRKFPVIPVVTAAAVVCIGVSAAIILMSKGNDNAPVNADMSVSISAESSANNAGDVQPVSISAESSVSDAQDVQSVSIVSNEEDKKEQPAVSEQHIEISEIDTSSIVFGDNVTVEGISLKGKTLAQAYDAMQDTLRALREKVNIKVDCDGKSVTLTQDDFEYDTDIANVLIQAYHFSRGELSQPNVATTMNNGVTNFKIMSALDKKSVGTAVKKAADEFDILPVNASVEKFEPDKVEKFTYKDGKNGFMIDQKELSDKISNILGQVTKEGSLKIEKKETPFEITLPILKANTKLIASTYTTAANVWASNYNMGLAIKSASGTIVKPGETFSFNKMTGDTTNGALGSIPSTAIVKGEYVQSYGGGICQASTTLYLCALRADMEPVERWAHAYPSVYADRGLDATVDYGNLDMKFKNTKDYPIYIATYVYDYDYDGLNELLVEMYGPLSTEYDEIVPVGWISWAGYDGYYGKGAKVYFKNGKEIKREYTPGGSYDYKYDTYSSALARIPANPDFGPTDVKPTMKPPAVFSPNGCGSNAPVEYGKAAEYLEKAKNTKTEKKPEQQSSQAQSSVQQSSQTQSSVQQSSQTQSSVQQSSQAQSSVQQSSQTQSSVQQSSQTQSSVQQSSETQSSVQQSSETQSSVQQSSQTQSSVQQSSETESSQQSDKPSAESD